MGVDTHRDVDVAVAVGAGGTGVARASLPADGRGCAEVPVRARPAGEAVRFGVGCTGTCGAGLPRCLSRERAGVVEVTAPERSVRRGRGRDDLAGAAMAAEAARTGARRAAPRGRGGMAGSLRVLTRARASAARARRAAVEQIRPPPVPAPDAVRGRCRGMTAARLVPKLAAPGPDASGYRDPTVATRIAPRSLAGRCQGLDDEVGELDAAIGAVPGEAAPLPPEGRCVGPQVAAQPTVTAGDNPERPRGEPSSAMPCGAAPRPASSGPTARHGLDRGGDRAASGAMRVVAVGRLGADGRTRAHVARKMSEGRPRLDAMRQAMRRARALPRHHRPGPHVENGLTTRRASQRRRHVAGPAGAGLPTGAPTSLVRPLSHLVGPTPRPSGRSRGARSLPSLPRPIALGATSE